MRYLPLTDEDRAQMRQQIGIAKTQDLFKDVPEKALKSAPLSHLPNHQGEMAVENHLANLAAKNQSSATTHSFLGGGLYHHHVPASVDALIQRGEFLTSYTPYQPEISQGTLQYLFEFQTMVARMTGMEIANASLYDGSTATAEAVMMARRLTRRDTVLYAQNLHPHYVDVMRAYAKAGGFSVDEFLSDENLDEKIACVVVQTPDVTGQIHDFAKLAEKLHAKGILLIVVVTEILSLGILKSPGAMGADIVVGEGQSLGNGLNFGGPSLGLLACRAEFVRQMPGRVCGETIDADGRRSFVLTLSTREQHIRREKATSNVCTNAGLCALAFTIHLSLLGEIGFQKLAALNHARAVMLAEKLEKLPGVKILTREFFNEFLVALPKPADEFVKFAAIKNILGGIPMARFYPDDAAQENHLLFAVTEMNDEASCDALVQAMEAWL